MSSSSQDHAPTITGGAGTPAPPISDAAYVAELERRVTEASELIVGIANILNGRGAYPNTSVAMRKFATELVDGVGGDPRPTVADGAKPKDQDDGR